MADDPKRGRCATCGFLCAIADEHSRVTNFKVYEVSPIKRATGLIMSGPHPTRPDQHVDVVIHCQVGAAQLLPECGSGFKGTNEEIQRGLILETINKDRGCGSWIRYVPGLSSQQHLEFARLDQLQENDRRQHDQMEALAKQQHGDMQRLETRHHRLNVGLTIVVILVMILQITIALLR